jgi:hypothetical protein
VPRRVDRRELDLPDFHAIRHAAAMDCEDAEEARDLLCREQIAALTPRL